MNKKLREKTEEALSSVLPITGIVLLLSMTLTPMPVGTLSLFLVGAVLLIIGMGFFSLGAEIAMMPMGEGIGNGLAHSRRLPLMVVIAFSIGAIITIAEPDLQVLAGQVPGIPGTTLILTVAVGVGVFLVVSMLKTLFKIPLSLLLLILYSIVIPLSFFIPDDFLSVAFDSGGVTTGPITVPFIMALGVGMASVRSGDDSAESSFGMVALCSVGPILAVMVLGLLYQDASGSYVPVAVPEILTTQDLFGAFLFGAPHYVKEVSLALAPIIVFFALYQIVTRRYYQRRALLRTAAGFLYTVIGLILFLTGVSIGFMPAGHYIGMRIAGFDYPVILLPLGMIMGYFLVKAEPAVLVLNRQVEELSGGSISQKAMMRSLSFGVAFSVGLSMLRVLTGLSILYIVVPGYAIALILSRFCPKIFTAVAFDSGGVASGPMATTFLLPFAMGACEQIGGNMLRDAFGVVAMVALTPLITIQILGIAYRVKLARAAARSPFAGIDLTDDIIIYEEEAD